MAEITAARQGTARKSGAGMMDCKKALTENEGDMEAAIDWLDQGSGLGGQEPVALRRKAGRGGDVGCAGAVIDLTRKPTSRRATPINPLPAASPVRPRPGRRFRRHGGSAAGRRQVSTGFGDRDGRHNW